MLAPYLAYARAALQRRLAYRTANWAGLFTNLFFMFFRAYALMACFAERDRIGGLSVADVATYVTVTQALLMVCPQWGVLGLAASVRTGQVAMDLLRPVNLVGMYLAQRLAGSVYYVGARMVPVLAVGGAAGLLHPPPSAGSALVFAVSTALAACIAAGIQVLVETSSFWWESDRGVRYLVLGAALLPSGLAVPLEFFPDHVRRLFMATPFPYTLYAPTAMWMGELSGAAAWSTVAVQLGWVLAVVAACQLALNAGRRKLQVHGG